MINYVKRSLFVTVGLAVIGLGLFLGNPSRVDAAVKEGQKFLDWAVNCTTAADKKQVCFLSQTINSTKDDKQQVLAIYQVGYFGSGKTKILKMIQIIPPNVSIDPGTTLIISSKKLIAPGKYVNCTKDSCQALADISDNDLKTILSSNDNPSVGFMNSVGQQINLPFSTKGLEEGLKALK
ncbi:MAG: invasion associated locus B family protein [Rickettsia endosymbiont of Labidopullus appendiculatus]|nr:invasion associated locus B family protein [Rickettsia endosymbiont of Labidopullus appendiculatus]